MVHCGVDTDAFTPPTSSERGSVRPTVLFVGNIAASKGIMTTLEAVLRMRSTHPDVLLKIAGRGDDNTMHELRERIASAGAAANVDFCGFVGREALPELYRSADVFCSPAVYEGGAANVYIEAMACGCPVIASTAGGAVEVVSNGETGFLVPPNDVDAGVGALDSTFGDEVRRQGMRVACRTRVEEWFAMDKYINRVLAVYQRAVDRQHRPRHADSAAWMRAF